MQTSISQILAKTGGILTSRIGPLIGMWATYFAVQMMLFAVFLGLIGTSSLSALSAGDAGAFGAGIILTIILVYLVYFLIAFAQVGSLTAMASPLQRLPFGEALNAGARSALPMLGVLVILLIVYLIAAVVIGLMAGLLSMLGTAGSAILLILLVPAALYVACRLCLINAVIAVERIGNPIKAISRGWGLTRGYVMVILGIMLIFLVAIIVVGGLLFLPFFNVINSAAAGQVPNFGGMIFSSIGLFAFSIAVSIISAALFSVIHSELSGKLAEDAGDVFS